MLLRHSKGQLALWIRPRRIQNITKIMMYDVIIYYSIILTTFIRRNMEMCSLLSSIPASNHPSFWAYSSGVYVLVSMHTHTHTPTHPHTLVFGSVCVCFLIIHPSPFFQVFSFTCLLDILFSGLSFQISLFTCHFVVSCPLSLSLSTPSISKTERREKDKINMHQILVFIWVIIQT